MSAKCSMCGVEVEPKGIYCYHKVTGWERYRQGGGCNQITMRKVLPEYLCVGCATAAKVGYDAEQGTLF